MRNHGTVWQRDGVRGHWVGKFEVAGKQHWVTGGPFGSARAAQAALDEQRERVVNPRAAVLTCEVWGDRWLVEWPRKSPGTQQLYALAVEKFTDEFGDRPLDELAREEVRSWALQVPRNYSAVIGTMYADALDIGIIEGLNPARNLRLPRSAMAEVAPPSSEELVALLRACSVLGLEYAKEFRAFILFAAWTGLRSSELQALQWRDIESESIWVRRARKSDGTYGLPKNQTEPEQIAFPLEARVLDDVARRAGEYSEYVFHTPTGSRLTKSNLYHLWEKVRSHSGTSVPRIEDGVNPIRLHDLRHFCATQWLERGLSPFDVSVQLRHKDGGALVMSRYGHPSRKRARNRLLAVSLGDGQDVTRSLPRNPVTDFQMGQAI